MIDVILAIGLVNIVILALCFVAFLIKCGIEEIRIRKRAKEMKKRISAMHDEDIRLFADNLRKLATVGKEYEPKDKAPDSLSGDYDLEIFYSDDVPYAIIAKKDMYTGKIIEARRGFVNETHKINKGDI